jgi:hypothetical protein
MDASAHPEIDALHAALDATEHDARAVAAGLDEARGTWRAAPGTWSVAECLDHLATANRVYVDAMEGSAARALANGRRRRGPAEPGLIGGWFVASLEPPAKPGRKLRAPRKIQPRSSPALADALAQFLASHERVRAFLRTYADIDLAHVHFPNPFIKGLRFSLATGIHVIPAHERRHLWQAWRVRRAAESAAAA